MYWLIERKKKREEHQDQPSRQAGRQEVKVKRTTHTKGVRIFRTFSSL